MMRRGEILGLRWQDVDLDASTLRVRTSLEETKQGLRLKSPKTKAGRRSITLPAVTVEALRDHRREQSELRLALGIGGRSKMVFTRHDGELLRPRNFSKEYRRASKAAGVDATFHSLRHSHASELLRKGIPIAVVSKRLGHSKISTTLDIYTHCLPNEQDQAAALMDAALGDL
jgi:integrase